MSKNQNKKQVSKQLVHRCKPQSTATSRNDKKNSVKVVVQQSQRNDKTRPVQPSQKNDKTRPVQQSQRNDKTRPVQQAQRDKKPPVQQSQKNDKTRPVQQAQRNDKKSPVQQSQRNDKTRPVHQSQRNDKIHPVKGELLTPKQLEHRYISSIAVSKDDKKRSVKAVHDRVDKIMHHVRKQENGQIYGNELRNAGSYSTKTKVGKADEFDMNVPLDIKEADVEISTKGKIHYKYEHPQKGGPNPSNLNVQRPISKTSQKIPSGCAAVKLRQDTKDAKKFKNVQQDGFIDPRKVKKDLHGRMNKAIKDLGMEDVNLSRESHGPAVTLTIKDSKVGHHISVDVSPTIDQSPVPITQYGWPRRQTKKTLDNEKISKVVDAGTHLVPKGDEFWYASFSKGEKELLTKIDDDNGCRKKCHQLMKKDFEKMKSQSTHGYPGISTHIFRNALLLHNETQPDWKSKNLAERYVEHLGETKRYVDKKKLPNYFNRSENVLDGKDPKVLKDLSKAIASRRDELKS